MRLLKLAWRIINADRRQLLTSAAALSVSVAVIIVLGSAVTGIAGNTAASYRRTTQGDYSLVVQPREVQSVLTALRTTTSRQDAGLVTTWRQSVPGIVHHEKGAMPLVVATVSLTEEVAFQDLPAHENPGGVEGLVPGDAILLLPPPGEERHPLAGNLTGTPGLAVITESGSMSVRVLSVVTREGQEPALLVHADGPDLSSPTLLLGRGVSRTLPPRTRRDLEALGFTASSTEALTATATRPARVVFVGLCAAMLLLSVLVQVPTTRLLLRRHEAEFRNLRIWGFPERRIATLVGLMGGLAAGVSAVLGAAGGLGAIAVSSARDMSHADQFPGVTALLGHGTITSGLVSPDLLVVVVAMLVSVVAGIVAALPSIRVAGTITDSG